MVLEAEAEEVPQTEVTAFLQVLREALLLLISRLRHSRTTIYGPSLNACAALSLIRFRTHSRLELESAARRRINISLVVPILLFSVPFIYSPIMVGVVSTGVKLSAGSPQLLGQSILCLVQFSASHFPVARILS
jgi:hypothetical protein